MCGIAGLLSAAPAPEPRVEEAATRMREALVHRGPDSAGTWADPGAGIGLAHRRLAIIDLSPEGAQPMTSASGRYVVTFNGEIYNYLALRAELAALGHAFRGHSDTEVLLAAVEQWGVEVALQRSNGMFALALWDARERRLHLARDRMGEKPLYYGWFGATFLFGSELKALRAHPAFVARVDRDVLALFMRHAYIPAPYSIYEGVRKVPAGHLLTVSAARPGEAKVESYWSHRAVAERGASDPFTGTPQEAVAEVEALLRESVKLRMQADVPLGAFLSGGIDSSTIVALMQAQSTRRVRTFTIGFREDEYNEAEHARAVARHLGTEHTELYLRAEDALAVIPRLPAMYDEPFADSSQIPTFLVSELTRRSVTVSLSGDGGDELFCGYRRYASSIAIHDKLRAIPHPVRAIATEAMRRVPSFATARLPAGWAQRMEAWSDLVPLRGGRELYRAMMSEWRDPAKLVLRSRELPTPFGGDGPLPRLATFADEMMFTDALVYLPDCILVKVDRASMAVSLEARVPLLDHRLVELAWRLPVHVKQRDGTTKWVLRQILHRHVPPALVERPKMGFAVPIADWLRGPLRSWATELLAPGRLKREGYLDPGLVHETLQDHLSGRRSRPAQLWAVLMFQSWLATQAG